MDKLTRTEIQLLRGSVERVEDQIRDLVERKDKMQRYLMLACPHEDISIIQEDKSFMWFTRLCNDCGATEVVDIDG